MTTLAEHIIIAGAENRPLMLEKSMYDSWESRIRLFIKGKKHGRMMLDSIDNGPLVYPTVEENGQTRPKKYSELTEAQQLQDDCDVQATNIILHGLPPDVYALVNHQEVAKDIWDRVKMLMKGTELSYQEHECRLYNLFDKFAHVPVQLNTKFSNALSSEWSKFVTDVKYPDYLAFVANSPTIYNPSQLPEHSVNPVNPQQHLVSPPPFISPSMTPQPQAEFPQLDSGLAVPTFQQGEYPIECIYKAMAFLSAIASRFPPSNNQLRTSSNPRNQATIQDGNKGIATTSKGNVAVGTSRVVKCYNCQGEGHTARQYDLDAYDSDCDDLSSAKVVLMANLSSCDYEVLFEVPIPILIRMI
ncbi:retrovirus-related pol polyprotein from transposon TNT 1-94 [Tanacetum coccineum]